MDRATPTSRGERPLIHNPNYPPRPSPSYPSFNPPAQHPTPQQPAFDPFQRRDPFMPASQAEKRDSSAFSGSYNSNDTRNSISRPSEFPSKDVLQPAQPPPPSPFGSGPASLFKDGENRRKSLSGNFSGESQIPPPPPPSLFSRQMLPPSSSPGQNTAPAYAGAFSRSHITTPPSSRDGAPSQRQGNNMSIQSIMGSEPSSAPPTSSWSMNRLSSDASRPPHTPEKALGEQRQQPGSHLGSPDFARMGMSRLLQPFSIASPTSSTVPPRPFSQPAGSDVPNRDQNRFDDPGFSPHKRKFDEFATSSRRVGTDEQEKFPAERTSRDRSISDLAGSKSQFHALGLPRHAGSNHIDDYRHVRERWGSSSENTREQGRYPRNYEMETRIPGYPPTTRPRSFGPEIHGHDDLQRIHPDQREQPNNTHLSTAHGDRQMDYGASPPIANDGLIPKSFGPENQLRKSIEDAQLPLKPMFNAQTEAARRIERGSPLPQAVQGVSAQPVGSGRDPGIKTEFGRMFSGLGSGVGSTPQPPAIASSNGAPTPSRQSPARVDDDNEASAKNGHRDQRLGPRVGLQHMSYPDDDRRPDSDSEGRISPVPTSERGDQRSKRAQSTHHHHHHIGAPVHHHHHHHWRLEDEPSPPIARRIGGTPMTKTNSHPNYGAAHGAFPPHHHHHVHPHHHHHPSGPSDSNQLLRPQAPPPPPIHRPTATVKSLALLSSLSHLPRKHLGSQLYSPSVITPPNSITPLESKFHYSVAPNPLPRFDGKENCTFTVRVPRTYLSDTTRELICRERRVWGTDVYTDDTDPLGAAIHAGWILGAWGDDVDISTLDLSADSPLPTTSNGIENDGSAINGIRTGKTTPTDVSTSTTVVNGTRSEANAPLTEPPTTGPVMPPGGHDLHLTLLVLPTLEHYASSVWHGLKSRTWGSNHDGMSFKVHKVEWVKEGEGSRFEERGGSARKKRLATMLNQRRAVMGVM